MMTIQMVRWNCLILLNIEKSWRTAQQRVSYLHGESKDENENIIDGEIHLDGVNVNRWIEISKETLEKYFVEVEV